MISDSGLREGIKAILIITAIIVYLLKVGHRDKPWVIYSGCLNVFVLSGITAVLVKWSQPFSVEWKFKYVPLK